ncbi:MAG: hypothetical protein ACRCVT_06230 [Leadbetterella sp.]
MRIRLLNLLFLIFTVLVFSCKDKTDGVDPGSETCATCPNLSPKTATLDQTFVHDWTRIQLRFIRETPGFVPPVAARAIAYSSLALYESVVMGIPGQKSMVGQFNGFDKFIKIDTSKIYDWATVASVAQFEVTVNIFNSGSDKNMQSADSLNKFYLAKFKIGKKDDVYERSKKLGFDLATAILEYAKKDGGSQGYLKNYESVSNLARGAGNWKPIGLQRNPLLPKWGNNRLFYKKVISEIDTLSPLPFSFDANSGFFASVDTIYKESVTLNEADKLTAEFFYDGPGSMGSFGHHLYIFDKIVKEEKLDLAQLATVYLKFATSMSDMYVLVWKEKYKYFLLRPQSYIREAIDPEWISNLAAPAYPDYPSSHIAGASLLARLLKAEFPGVESLAFVDDANSFLFEPRPFDNIDAYVNEVVMAKRFSGTFYPFTFANSKVIGDLVAQQSSIIQTPGLLQGVK